MHQYTIYVRYYLDQPSRVVASVFAKSTKAAFNKAVKILPSWHSSRIRVERVE